MKSKQMLLILAAAVVVLGGGLFVVMRGSSDENETSSEATNTLQEVSEENKTITEKQSNLPTQTVGQQPDCSLYTLEDISKIWSVPMTDTDVDGSKVRQITGPQNYAYSCSYNETDSGKGLAINIEYKVYESKDAAQTSIKNTRDGAKFGDKVYFINDEVEGIGDEAFFSKSANQDSLTNKVEEQLYARDGNVVYLLTAVDLDGVQSNTRDKILETYRLRLQ